MNKIDIKGLARPNTCICKNYSILAGIPTVLNGVFLDRTPRPE